MASLDTTAFAAALLQKYPKQRIQWMAYKNHPLLALMPKDTGFGGKNKVVPVRYGTPQGASVTFATALANKLASKITEFTITRVNYYTLASITGETLEASQGSSNALLEASKFEIEGAMQTASRTLAYALYRNGGGARGQISAGSDVTQTTITLANVADIVNFSVGMKVQTASTDGTSGALDAATELTINAIDRDAGTLTASAAWNTIAGNAASHYIFQSGDFGGHISGLSAWVPATAPSATSFFGVDRSTDVVALGGMRITASGTTLEEKLINAIARASREGAQISHIFMNPLKRADLVKQLGSKVQYARAESNIAGIGFKTVQIEGDSGPVDIIADPDCPYTACWGLQMDTWELNSLGEAPKFINMRGKDDLIVEYNADALEIRVGYRAQLACYAPGYNFYMAI